MEYNKNDNKRRLEVLASLKKKAYASLASTSEGRLVLYFMMKDCGFTATSLVKDEKNNIMVEPTIVNEALRGYYLGVRRFIPTELLKEIEYLNIEEYILKEGEQDGRTN